MNETYFDQSDVEQNKTMVLLSAILQIFIPILFFLPLVCCQNSSYGKFYANQGLLILLLYIASSVVLVIPVYNGIFNIDVFHSAKKSLLLIRLLYAFSLQLADPAAESARKRLSSSYPTTGTKCSHFFPLLTFMNTMTGFPLHTSAFNAFRFPAQYFT